MNSPQTTSQHIVNAAIQLIPLGIENPYPLIDEAISLIQQSGFRYEVGPFSTSLEAPLNEVFKLVSKIQEMFFEKGGNEMLINLQIQARKGHDVTGEEKVGKFRN